MKPNLSDEPRKRTLPVANCSDTGVARLRRLCRFDLLFRTLQPDRTMINTLFLPELREMLAENDVEQLREFCTALHPARTAEFMEGLGRDEAWSVLQHADDGLRAEIFSYFDP